MKGRVENWRDIHGYNGWYQISTEGRVRSYKAVSYTHLDVYKRQGITLYSAYPAGYAALDGMKKHRLHDGAFFRRVLFRSQRARRNMGLERL